MRLPGKRRHLPGTWAGQGFLVAGLLLFIAPAVCPGPNALLLAGLCLSSQPRAPLRFPAHCSYISACPHPSATLLAPRCSHPGIAASGPPPWELQWMVCTRRNQAASFTHSTSPLCRQLRPENQYWHMRPLPHLFCCLSGNLMGQNSTFPITDSWLIETNKVKASVHNGLGRPIVWSC